MKAKPSSSLANGFLKKRFKMVKFMAKEMVEWLHGFLVIGQREFQFVTKFDDELFRYLQSGKKIAVKDVVVYEIEKYEVKKNEQ